MADPIFLTGDTHHEVPINLNLTEQSFTNPAVVTGWDYNHVLNFVLQHSGVYEKLKKFVESRNLVLNISREGGYGKFEIRFSGRPFPKEPKYIPSLTLSVGLDKRLYYKDFYKYNYGVQEASNIDEFISLLENQEREDTIKSENDEGGRGYRYKPEPYIPEKLTEGMSRTDIFRKLIKAREGEINIFENQLRDLGFDPSLVNDETVLYLEEYRVFVLELCLRSEHFRRQIQNTSRIRGERFIVLPQFSFPTNGGINQLGITKVEVISKSDPSGSIVDPTDSYWYNQSGEMIDFETALKEIAKFDPTMATEIRTLTQLDNVLSGFFRNGSVNPDILETLNNRM